MFSSYLSSFASTVAGRSSCCDQPSAFQHYLRQYNDVIHPLQLAETLLQVFNFVDSTTLCTTVPLVCKLWHKAATDSQLWTPQLPQQVLAVAAAHAAATATYCNRHNKSQLIVARGQLPLNFPQMHHAIYSRNFLRNPGFCQSHNSDYMRLIRMRPTSWVNKQGPRGAAGLGLNSQSNISNEQRRLAWVTAANGPEAMSWESLAADTHHPPPPPVHYPSYNSSSSISQQIQGWLKGLTASAVSSAAAVAAAGGALVSDQTSQRQQKHGGVGCLATDSSWGEVVQVVDLFEELTMRGLSSSLAAALLDSGALALGLSVWAAAAAADDSSSSSSSSNNQSLGSSSLQAERYQQCEAAAVDAGSAAQAALRVALMLDDGQVPLKTFQTFVRRESSHHFVSQRVAVMPGGWKRYTYLLSGCPRGCRRAVVLLRGRGPLMHQQQQQQQQGRSNSSSSSDGVRFASAELVFVKQQEAQSWQDGSVILT